MLIVASRKRRDRCVTHVKKLPKKDATDVSLTWKRRDRCVATHPVNPLSRASKHNCIFLFSPSSLKFKHLIDKKTPLNPKNFPPFPILSFNPKPQKKLLAQKKLLEAVNLVSNYKKEGMERKNGAPQHLPHSVRRTRRARTVQAGKPA